MAPAGIQPFGAAVQLPFPLHSDTSAFTTSAQSIPLASTLPSSIPPADSRSYPPKCHIKPSGSHTESTWKSKADQAWDTADSIWQSIRAKAEEVLASYNENAEILDQDTIPDYVFKHAPYVHLYSGEQFWPCSLDSHLFHTTPHLNYTPITISSNLTVANLSSLNTYGFYTYLQSDDNVESRPTWLAGTQNIPSDPDSSSSTPNTTSPGGHSSAPAILLTIRKPNNILDAFWFYFYSYNLGNKVGLRFGNHVGDWEHTLVRFRHGRPVHVFLSEHNFGEAYAWSALEKIGPRPVTFSATGSHAMYATPGSHPYVLPLGLLHDQTDRGPLWDPSQNVYTYTFDLNTRRLRASSRTPDAPTDWFYYRGHWGDRAYPMSDERQYKFAGQYHYVSGPLGPIYKNLGRGEVCQGRGRCRIKYWLPPAGEVGVWDGEIVQGEKVMEEDDRVVIERFEDGI